MLTFEPIASSSLGNAYKVSDGRSTILLECGIRLKDIQKAFNFRLSDIDGCLITHEHQDHCQSIQDILKKGIDCYMSEGTANALDLKHHRVKHIQARKQFKLGTFMILPFEVEHDVSEPLGYLIANEEGEKLLFATDTYYIRYRFKDLTIVAVECNYSEDILRQNILDGHVPVIHRKRLQRSHFSLENYKDFIRANDMSSVREIWLLHLSNRNSNADHFKREIAKMTGKVVHIA